MPENALRDVKHIHDEAAEDFPQKGNGNAKGDRQCKSRVYAFRSEFFLPHSEVAGRHDVNAERKPHTQTHYETDHRDVVSHGSHCVA